jgi:hypothetical protein
LEKLCASHFNISFFLSSRQTKDSRLSIGKEKKENCEDSSSEESSDSSSEDEKG